MSSTSVSVVGDIDVATAPSLRSRIREAVDANPGEAITGDLSGLDFIDSTGLGVLVGALKYARQSEGSVVLSRPRPEIWKVFTITGLDRVFEVTAASAA